MTRVIRMPSGCRLRFFSLVILRRYHRKRWRILDATKIKCRPIVQFLSNLAVPVGFPKFQNMANAVSYSGRVASILACDHNMNDSLIFWFPSGSWCIALTLNTSSGCSTSSHLGVKNISSEPKSTIISWIRVFFSSTWQKPESESLKFVVGAWQPAHVVIGFISGSSAELSCALSQL